MVCSFKYANSLTLVDTETMLLASCLITFVSGLHYTVDMTHKL